MEFEHITVPDGIDTAAMILPQREAAGDTVPILHGIDVLFLAEAALERVYFAGGTVDLESAQKYLSRAITSDWLYYIDSWLWKEMRGYLVRFPEPLEAATDVLEVTNPVYFPIEYNRRNNLYAWERFPSFGFTVSPELWSDDAIEDELTMPSSPSWKILTADMLRYYYDMVKRMNYLKFSTTEELDATYTLSCEKVAGTKDFVTPDDPVDPNAFVYRINNGDNYKEWYGKDRVTYEYYYQNKAKWADSHEERYGGYIWTYLFERSFYSCGRDFGSLAEYLTADDSDIVAVVDFCIKEAVLETQSGEAKYRTFMARKSVAFQRSGNALIVSNGELCKKASEAMEEVGVKPRTDCWTQGILVYHEHVVFYCGLREKTRLDKGDETTA